LEKNLVIDILSTMTSTFGYEQAIKTKEAKKIMKDLNKHLRKISKIIKVDWVQVKL